MTLPLSRRPSAAVQRKPCPPHCDGNHVQEGPDRGGRNCRREVWETVSRDQSPRCPDRSPAARLPLVEGPPLGSQRGVVAVPGVEPGLVGEAVEELGPHVVDQRPEALLAPEG